MDLILIDYIVRDKLTAAGYKVSDRIGRTNTTFYVDSTLIAKFHATDPTDSLAAPWSRIKELYRFYDEQGLGPRLFDIIDLSDHFGIVVFERGHSSLDDKNLWPQVQVQVSQIIDKLHSFGYLHCDIIPSNVIIRHDGSIFLIDFVYSLSKNHPDDALRRKLWKYEDDQNWNDAQQSEKSYAMFVNL
jgi:serine/threonine protein kinase